MTYMDIKRRVMIALLSLLPAAALCMDMGIPDLHLIAGPERDALLGMPEIIWNLYGSINWLSFSVVWILCFFFLCSEKRDVSAFHGSYAFFSLVLGCIYWMAQGFGMEDGLDILFASVSQLIKSIIFIAGTTIVMYELISGFMILMHRYNRPGSNGLSFFKTWMIIGLAWTPYLIVSFPGNIAPDTYNELSMFFSDGSWSAIHPIFHVWYTGFLFRAGSVIGGDFAVFLYCIIQATCFATILSYMHSVFIEMHTPNWLRGFWFVVIIVSPYYTNYISIVLKDCLYSYMYTLMMIELVYMMLMRDSFFESRRHCLLWGLSVSGTLLFRINGKYMIVPLVIILLALAVYKYKDTKVIFRPVCVLAYPLLFATVVICIITAKYDVRSIRSSELLSFPAQQTARYVKEHEDEVTEEEKAAIGEVFSYDELAESYNPRVADPVKRLVDNSAISKDKKILWRYLETWLSMGIKHPETYVAAIAAQNYYLFYPGLPNNIALVGIAGDGGFGGLKSYSGTLDIARDIGLDINEVECLVKPQKILFILYQGLFFCPGIGMISHPAFYTTVFFILFITAIEKKYYRYLLVSTPLLINIVGVAFGPVIQRNPRYVFPVIYAVPLLVALYLYYERKDTGDYE